MSRASNQNIAADRGNRSASFCTWLSRLVSPVIVPRIAAESPAASGRCGLTTRTARYSRTRASITNSVPMRRIATTRWFHGTSTAIGATA